MGGVWQILNDISDFARYYPLPKIVADSTSMPIMQEIMKFVGVLWDWIKLIVDNIAISAIFLFAVRGKLGI